MAGRLLSPSIGVDSVRTPLLVREGLPGIDPVGIGHPESGLVVSPGLHKRSHCATPLRGAASIKRSSVPDLIGNVRKLRVPSNGTRRRHWLPTLD